MADPQFVEPSGIIESNAPGEIFNYSTTIETGDCVDHRKIF